MAVVGTEIIVGTRRCGQESGCSAAFEEERQLCPLLPRL